MGKTADQKPTTDKKPTDKKVNKVPRKSTAPVRLWTKAAFVGFRGGKNTQNNNQPILRIQGVSDKHSARFYLGKKIVYVYKARNTTTNLKTKKETKIRTIWGKVTRIHGNTGAVNARFRNNLPPRALGSTLRVMLYPNRD